MLRNKQYYNENDPEIIHVNWNNQEYLFKIGILTENRGFLIQEADILLAEEDFIEHWLGTIR